LVENADTPVPPAAGALTRERLLDAAAALFATMGYAGTTTRELAGAVGIRNASMYHHVRGKDELLHELCIESLTRILEAGRAAVAGERDPAARLLAVIVAHVETILEDRDTHATMLNELRSLAPGAREEVVRLRDAYEELLTEVIADAQAAGTVRTDIATRHLTLALLNLLNWTIFWFRPERELTPSVLGQMLASLFLDGARDRPDC
jgi:AcrR family transcriptional regulator